MASIHKIKNREGVVYVRMYEGWRENGKVKTAVVKNFGRLDKLEENGWGTFEELQQRVRNNEIEFVSKRGQIVKKIDLNEPISNEKLLDYGWLPLNRIYNELGITDVINEYQKTHCFKYDLDKVLKLLVFSRILNPKSKSRTVINQENLFGSWDIDQNAMDRGLDHLFELMSQIQQATHKSISDTYGRTGSLVFYDVTNFFFTIDKNDEYIIDENGDIVKGGGLRVKGFSKEHRPEQIVQLGLFMDSKGIPISFKLFPGNFNDPKTYVPAIKQVKQQFGLERIVTVADKAMNSITNVTDAKLNGDGYIFSSKVRGERGVPKDIQDFALEKDGWKYNADMTYAIKSAIRKRKLSNGKSCLEKMVVVWSEKYAKRQKSKRNGALNHAVILTNSERYRQSCKTGAKKFIEQYSVNEDTGEKTRIHPFLDIDWDIVKEDEKYDGINVILTSELTMHDDEILKEYHNLSKIEDCFRVSKSDFKARPVYVWTVPHIYAHFLTCFLSLQIMRILQMKTWHESSIEKLVTAMNSAKTKRIDGEYWDVSANSDFSEMIKKLGGIWDKRNVHESKIFALGK